jgi:hypothetical protein
MGRGSMGWGHGTHDTCGEWTICTRIINRVTLRTDLCLPCSTPLPTPSPLPPPLPTVLPHTIRRHPNTVGGVGRDMVLGKRARGRITRTHPINQPPTSTHQGVPAAQTTTPRSSCRQPRCGARCWWGWRSRRTRGWSPRPEAPPSTGSWPQGWPRTRCRAHCRPEGGGRGGSDRTRRRGQHVSMC